MAGLLTIDGAHGEGGGQILRTALSLAALTGRAIRIENVRAGRAKPGLAAQHLTAVRAAASLCAAWTDGDRLGSTTLVFAPGAPVEAGAYRFDVAEAREGGSAGAAALVLQTLLPALALAAGTSEVAIRGGTHMAWSPPYDYLANVWLPVMRQIGFDATVDLAAFGWFPAGQGEIRARIAGLGPDGRARLRPIELLERGALREITGRAIAANLPAHIPQRMTDRARALLSPLGVPVRIAPLRVRAASPGAGIFLGAHYEHAPAGFTALGAPGKASETVAEEAVATLLAHHGSRGALDVHLADQVLLPLALAPEPSVFSAERSSRHLETNAWAIGQFGIARIDLDPSEPGRVVVRVTPMAWSGDRAVS